MTKRPVPLWRLIAGAFLHFGILAFLIVVPLAGLLTAPAGASLADLARLGLTYSIWFLVIFGAIALLATAIAALMPATSDGERRHRLDADGQASKRRLVRAAVRMRALPDPTAGALFSTIVGGIWQHEDPRYQALSRDLDEVLRVTDAALASAPPEKLPVIRRQLMSSLDYIRQAQAELHRDYALVDENSARAVALYVQRRYGELDFAIKPD